MKNHAPDVPGFLRRVVNHQSERRPMAAFPRSADIGRRFWRRLRHHAWRWRLMMGQSPGASFALKMPGKPGADQRRPASMRPDPICPGGRNLIGANWISVRSHLSRFWVASRRTAFSANDRAMGDEYEYLAMARARERT